MSATEHVRGRRALVTGGNRGIGLEVVRQLRDLGVGVFLGTRDLDGGAAAAEALGSSGITPVRIDVADAQSVRAARGAIGPEGIDIL